MSSSATEGYSTSSIAQHHIDHPTLPFTGLDMGLLVVMATLFALVGFGIRKYLIHDED